MDVSIGPDQQLVIDTAARLAESFATTSTAGLPSRGDLGDEWRQLVETGFVGLRLPESVGGGGATGVDVALVVEQFARTLSTVPYLGQAVLGPELLRAGEASDELLAAVIAGERRITVAFDPSLRTFAAGGPGIAVDAAGADAALMFTADGSLALAPIERADAEPSAPVASADLTRVLVGTPDASAATVVAPPLPADRRARIEALALAALAADLVGVMQGALDAAVAYVCEREQFGVPVGSFQAVQHMAADAKVALEASRGSMWHAAWAVDELDASDALLAARQAKAYCSRAGRDVVEIMVQMLGGIAITWEELAHLRVRRVLLDRVLLGDEHVQEDAIADARLEVVR